MIVVDVVLVKIKSIVDIIITFTGEEEEYVSLVEFTLYVHVLRRNPNNASRTILRWWRGEVLHAHREKITPLKMV